MFRLLKFLKGRDLKLTILSFVLILIQTTCDVAQPFLLAYMLKDDNGSFWIQSENNPLGGIGGVAGIMIACIFIALVSQCIGIVTSAKVGVRLGSKIRFEAFRKIQSLTSKEIDDLTTPSLITRLTNDIMYFQNAVIISIRMLFRSLFLILGGVIATFVIGAQLEMWWLGLIFFGFMIIVILSIFLILKRSVPHFRKQQKTMDSVNSVMRENLLGVRVIKAFNMQSEEMQKFDIENNKLAKISTTANRWATSIIPVIYFVIQISVVIIIVAIGAFFSNGANKNDFELTVVLQVIQLTSLVVLGVVLIVNVLIILAYTKASCDRINGIFDKQPSIPRNISNNKIESSHVVFSNVSFKYNDSQDADNALSNISFEAKSGEMIGIIGPTGSGKTTIINLLTRMYDVNEGEILISGMNVKDINYISLRDSIGVSPQKSIIISGTIGTNLKFGKEDASIQEMEDACNLAQAMEFVNQKEGKFDAIVEQRGTNLSGGQKQRISIARALIKKPKILVLDDSTSALDMITEAKVQDAVRKSKNTTIFLIGQRINAISKADKIIVLDKGHMVGYGTHNQLMKKCSLYKDISISQGFGK